MSKVSKIKHLAFPLIFLTAILFLRLGGKPLLSSQLSPGAPQVDPFYLRLFDEGMRAFNQGEYEEAAQSLKIAAFGLLDEPDFLGEAFVYLTLCAYKLKKPDQVEYYLKEISRFKLSDRIHRSKLPKEIKDLLAKIQAEFKNGVTG